MTEKERRERQDALSEAIFFVKQNWDGTPTAEDVLDVAEKFEQWINKT